MIETIDIARRILSVLIQAVRYGASTVAACVFGCDLDLQEGCHARA